MEITLKFADWLKQRREEKSISANHRSSDPALVQLAQNGDRSAFGQLYTRYAPMVHSIILAQVPRMEVEDLVQDVFLIALNRLSTLRDADAFGGWLAMIARNRARDYFRTGQNTEDLNEGIIDQRSSDSEAIMVLTAIRSLPESYRETLIMRLVEGMTGPEIAERAGLTPDSVRVNLHRGMKMLREKLTNKD